MEIHVTSHKESSIRCMNYDYCSRIGFLIGFVSCGLLQLDIAAPMLAQDSKPIVVAKIDAEKHARVASKYKIRYCFHTLIFRLLSIYLASGPVAVDFMSSLASQGPVCKWNRLWLQLVLI